MLPDISTVTPLWRFSLNLTIIRGKVEQITTTFLIRLVDRVRRSESLAVNDVESPFFLHSPLCWDLNLRPLRPCSPARGPLPADPCQRELSAYDSDLVPGTDH